VHTIVRPVDIGRPSFLGAIRCTALELLDADVAVLGMPFTTPDDLNRSRSPSSDAPNVVRRQSERLAGVLTHHDFDLGGSLFDGRTVSMADCGDVWGEPGKFDYNSRAATSVVEVIREAGALPIVIGGDHAAVLAPLRAYSDQRSLCVVHVGAELHWRDEIGGVRDGARSGMRRASELPWVTSMIHLGLRGVGSARQQDVDDAVAFGSELVRAEEVHEWGVEKVLRCVPRAAAYYICLDADGLDPSIAPGVELPAFGGLSYFEASNLLKGLATRGPVVGLALLGIVPPRDLNDITSLLGARLILNVLGALARADGFHPREATQPSVSALVRY
jgi:agmatinase